MISTSGLGRLTVGTTPPESNAGAAMIEWNPTYSAEVTDPGTDPGRWVASGYGEETRYEGDPVTPFYVDASEAGVHRIDVLGASPATGIRTGSTVEQLQAAHPTLVAWTQAGISRVWSVQDAAGALVFETQGDADGPRPPGTAESVILIPVLRPGASPEFSTANTDDVAGGCLRPACGLPGWRDGPCDGGTRAC